MAENYAHMSHEDKTGALMDIDKGKLVEQLLRLAQQVEGHTRTQKLHFEHRPDQAAAAYAKDALPVITYDDNLSYLKPGELAHRLLIGDNVDALVGLTIRESSTYDVIYIDPPYNTGKSDFTYNDRYLPEDDAWRHAKWLSFMESRLRLARELLKPTGVIMVAIDSNEHHHLRSLMDAVLGENNFIANVTWQGARKNDSRFISSGEDYMLVYAKSKSTLIDVDVKWRVLKPGADDVLVAGRKCWQKAVLESAPILEIPTWGLPLSDEDWSERCAEIGINLADSDLMKRASERATIYFKKWWKELPGDHEAKHNSGLIPYSMVDSRGVFRSSDLSWPGGGGPRYDVVHPRTGKPVKIPSRGWLATPEKMRQWLEEDRILFGSDHTKSPGFKRYLADTMSEVVTSIINKDRRNARKHVSNIIGDAFTFPKDHHVLAQWIGMVAPDNAKVLDFFAGSGSTAEAVLTLNAADGGSRTFTLVTNDEAGIGTNVTRERIVRVMTGENWKDPKKAVALGGQLAVHRVTQTTDGGRWNPSAAAWLTLSSAPFHKDHGHGVVSHHDGKGTTIVVALTEEPSDYDAELVALNVAIADSTDDTVLLTPGDDDDTRRYADVRGEAIGTPQVIELRRIRKHFVSDHSIDINGQLQVLIDSSEED